MNIGQKDQLQAALTELAAAMANYKEELIKVGFSEEQAFQMTVQCQNQIILKG